MSGDGDPGMKVGGDSGYTGGQGTKGASITTLESVPIAQSQFAMYVPHNLTASFSEKQRLAAGVIEIEFARTVARALADAFDRLLKIAEFTEED